MSVVAGVGVREPGARFEAKRHRVGARDEITRAHDSPEVVEVSQVQPLVAEDIEPTGVIQELANRDPATLPKHAGKVPLDRVVQLETAFGNEPKDESRNKRLRHARDTEAVARTHRLPRHQYGLAYCTAPGPRPVLYESDDARQPFRSQALEHPLSVRA
jgi:hypothetical protein